MNHTTISKRIITACIVAGAACTPGPDPDAPPSDSAAPARGPTTARVLGSCCPGTDSAIIALMARYESTQELDRPAELAALAYRMTSGLTEAERIVVKDSAAWATLWPRIVGSHRPMARVPSVDFSKEMLLVASMGTQRTGGYTIRIDSVSVVNDSIRVVVIERSPGPRCGTTAALSHPAALARLERSALPVTFMTRAVVHDCP